jgi:hypothetical protein
LRPRFAVLAALVLAGCGTSARISGTLVASDARPTDASDGGTADASDAGLPPDDAGYDPCPDPALASIQQKVFLPSCATSGCHSGAIPAEALDLSVTVDDLRLRLAMPSMESPRGIPLITPSKFGDSFLYLKMALDPQPEGELMPPPPAPKASDCELNAIKTWISNGAVD